MTIDDTADAAGDVTERVHSELVSLRSHLGITQHRVDCCPTICSLPVVASEATRLGVEPAVAAYQVIDCAVRNLVRQPNLRTILAITLNIEGHHGETLDERRAVLAGAIYMSPASSQLKKLEAIAYRELASELVRARRSPCKTDPPEADEVVDLSDGGDGGEVDRLSRLMHALIIEISEEVASRIASQMINELPTIRPKEPLRGGAALDYLNRLIDATEAAAHADAENPRQEFPRMQVALRWIEPARTAIQERAHGLAAKRAPSSAVSEIEGYFTSRRHAPLQIAKLWGLIESRGLWHVIPQYVALASGKK